MDALVSASDAIPAGSVPAPRSASGSVPAARAAEAADTECLHCGLPVPAPRRARGDRFCCGGCAHVYDLIRDSGLSRYYDLRTRRTAPPAEMRPDSLAWLDRMLAETPAEGVCTLRLDVQGIHCAACVWLLQEVYRRTDGAVDLCINPAVGRAELLWRAGSDTARDFVRQAERYGYRFGPARKRAAGASRGLQIRLAVCSAAAMNAMIFGLCFYLGLAPSDGVLFDLFGVLNLVLGTVAAVAGGDVFLRGAWRAARAGIVHLDLPIATGIVLAWGGSVWGHFAVGPQSGYFDSLAIFVTLMLVGRFLQERHLERNAAALLSTDGLGGLSTRVRRPDGRIESRPATDVAEGDELWIVPGDLVPVRAAALDGPVTASLDWIDGESRPRTFATGETLPAGSFNAGDGVLRARAEEGFEESRLHELLRPGRAADVLAGQTWGRVARIYVFAVFALAAAGFLAWLHAGPARALAVTVSILVVTCPCAIGIAMPLAHDLVHHALRRSGVFVRRAGFLDRALRVKHVIFDKTGTLTRGRLALTAEAERTLAGLPEGERRVLHDLVSRSNHPVSRAIAAALRDADPSLTAAPDLVTHETPGEGLSTEIDGRTYRLGKRSFALGDAAAAADAPGDDAAWWSVDGAERARLPYDEELRHDAVAEVKALGDAGYRVHLLSGDRPERVRTAAARIGIAAERTHAGCSPEAKARFVRNLDHGDTLTVGDGLNDAGAFEESACAATPAVDHAALPGRADFYYLGSGVSAVRAALAAAHRLRRVVRDDLILAGAYNAVALALCFAGLVTPPVAAVLMPVGSLGILAVTAGRLTPGRVLPREEAAWK